MLGWMHVCLDALMCGYVYASIRGCVYAWMLGCLDA